MADRPEMIGTQNATVIAYLEGEIDRLRVAVYTYVMDVTRCYPTTKVWNSHKVLLEALRGEHIDGDARG